MKKPVLLALLMGFATGLFGAASAEAACNDKNCSGLVRMLYLNPKTLYVRMQVDLAPLTCNPVSKTYLTIPVSSPVFREWHGMLLGAYLGGKPVSLRLNATKSTCVVSYVTIGK